MKPRYNKVARTSDSSETVAQFWSFVLKTEDCWMWLGTVREGYGRFWVDGHHVAAHAFAFVISGGTIPEGYEPDHLCRNKLCVRPDHLEPVDHPTNVLRGESPPARNARKERCDAGHLLEGYNLILWPSAEHPKMRTCRTCHNARQKEYKRARRERARAARG